MEKSITRIRIHNLVLFLGMIWFMMPCLSIAQDRINTDLLFEQARTMAFSGNRARARQMCLEILKRKPTYHDVRVFLGRLYAWDKDYKKATIELVRVLREKRTHKDALRALTDVALWTDKYQRAYQLSQAGLNQHTNDIPLLEKKARALIKLQRSKEASLVVDRILDLDPSNEVALKLLKDIRTDAIRNKMGLHYEYDSFDRGLSEYGPWHLAYLDVSRRTRIGTVIGRINWANRKFGSSDPKQGFQFEVDAYPRFRKGIYAYLNGGFSSASVFPETRFGGQLYFSLPNSYETSVGFRYLDFGSSQVWIYTHHLGKYVKNYWIAYWSFITKKPVSYSYSGYLMIRRYLGGSPENYWTLKAGFGSSPIETFTEADLITRLNSSKIGMDLQHMISPTASIKAGLMFEKEEYSEDTFGNRWKFTLAFRHFF